MPCPTQLGFVSLAIRKPLVNLQAATRLGWSVRLWFGVDELAACIQRLDGKAPLIRGTRASPSDQKTIGADLEGNWLTLQKLPRA